MISGGLIWIAIHTTHPTTTSMTTARKRQNHSPTFAVEACCATLAWVVAALIRRLLSKTGRMIPLAFQGVGGIDKGWAAGMIEGMPSPLLKFCSNCAAPLANR